MKNVVNPIYKTHQSCQIIFFMEICVTVYIEMFNVFG